MTSSSWEFVLLMMFLLLGSYFAGSLQSPTLAKPNCQESCGNVTIPFPFGIGSGECFLDEWYEIECKGNGMVAWLKKIDVEVLEITLPYETPDNSPGNVGVIAAYSGAITVNLPILYSDESCTSSNDISRSRMAPSLKGSPFRYSARKSIFVAVGCDRVVVINNTGVVLSGCTSKCGGSNSAIVSGKCSGYNGCCETSIPSLSLSEFGVKFMMELGSTTGGVAGCSYALLAKETWIRPELNDMNGLVKGGLSHGVLDWGIFKDSNLTAELTPLCGDHSWNASCSRFDGLDHTYDSDAVWFKCEAGFIGNPFFKHGCQDLDECADPNLNSCSHSCVNTYGSFHCKDRRKTVKLVMIGTGSGLGALLLLLLLWSSYKAFLERREIRQKQMFFKRNGGFLLQQQLHSSGGNVENCKLFSSEELEKATDNFNEDRILGKGGQGTVYKGMLTDGRIVAVKKSLAVDEGKIEEFINEVFILSQINHRNVVKLMGFCLETEIPLLVYEYIPNGTLYQYLHEPSEELTVSWDVRLRLATEVAGSLSYLHSAASVPIYHRDIKSTNILLDEKYRAKVADFGTSKSVSLEETHVTTLVQGTFGYLDPEYFQSSRFTDKSDVYSFGVVLVELLTGERPISSLRAEEVRGLASYFINSMEENQLHDILDPQIRQYADKEEVVAVANLARRCLHLSGRMRPSMREVAMVLEAIRKPLPHPDDVQQIDAVIGSMSIDQTSKTNGSSGATLTYTCSEVIARAHPMSEVPLLYDQTW